MPKNRSARLALGLVCVVLLVMIARNLYQAHLRREFLAALKAGDLATVRTLLQHGINPNTPIRNANQSAYSPAATVSPLFVAVESNSAPIVDLLLAQGAKPDSMAFNYATFNNYHAIAMTLLQHGADPNARSSDLAWKTINTDMPLTDAAGHADVPLVQAMLDKGADPNTKNINAQTALIIACQQGHRDVAAILLKRGADPNVMAIDRQSAIGRTALMTAVEKPDIGLARLLLDNKADVNAHQQNTSTALMLAAAFGRQRLSKRCWQRAQMCMYE